MNFFVGFIKKKWIYNNNLIKNYKFYTLLYIYYQNKKMDFVEVSNCFLNKFL